jgi:hypothetical protein
VPLSATAKRAFCSGDPDKTTIYLLTLVSATLGTLRYTENTVATPSRGEVWNPAPLIQLALTPSAPGQVPRVDFIVGVNDQSVMAGLRAVDDSPIITLEEVLAEDPDVVLAATGDLEIVDCHFGLLILKMDMTASKLFHVTVPKLAHTPDRSPGVHV